MNLLISGQFVERGIKSKKKEHYCSVFFFKNFDSLSHIEPKPQNQKLRTESQSIGNSIEHCIVSEFQDIFRRKTEIGLNKSCHHDFLTGVMCTNHVDRITGIFDPFPL